MNLRQRDRLKRVLGQAEAFVIGAGAGMGVDSGLPDFRGDSGFWVAYPQLRRRGLSFVDVAQPSWFLNDPWLAWGFYGHRLNLYRATTPHSGFANLLELIHGRDYWVWTSNVDGAFQKAGYDPHRIVEHHGSIHHIQCSNKSCSHLRDVVDASNLHIEVDEERLCAVGDLPLCSHCGSVMRPNILMFADTTWSSKRSYPQDKAYEEWLRGVSTHGAKTVIIEIGAGTAIPSVRTECAGIAFDTIGTHIRINPRESSGADIGIALGAKAGIEWLREESGL